MPEEKKVSRRGYVKYAAAGIVIVAGAAAGGYYATRPGPTPTPTPTPTETPKTTPKETPKPTPTPEKKRFEGIELTIAMYEGPAVTEPVRMHAPDWEKETGATVNFVSLPFTDLYPKMMEDFTTGAGNFDMVEYASWHLGDFWPYLVPLDSYIDGDQVMNWSDFLPSQQKLSSWGGKKMSVPFDGDFMALWWRRDVTEKYKEEFNNKIGYEMPIGPQGKSISIDQYLDVAKFFNGWDVDDDGKVEYGTILEGSRAGDNVLMCYMSQFLAPYTVMPNWKYKGVLWLDPDTMEPLINTSGAIRGFEKYMYALENCCPPGVLDSTRSTVMAYIESGSAVMGTDWHDIATDVVGGKPEAVKVIRHLGWASPPGSTEYYDREEDTWVEMPEGQLNLAPVLSWGGWLFSITNTCKNPDAAYDFIRYLASPEIYGYDVTLPYGNAPVRTSNITDPDMEAYKAAGWLEEEVISYLNDCVRPIHENPNAVKDLNIPGTMEYIDAFNVEAVRAFVGERSVKDALDEVAKSWDKITDRRGRDSQKQLYRSSLGIV